MGRGSQGSKLQRHVQQSLLRTLRLRQLGGASDQIPIPQRLNLREVTADQTGNQAAGLAHQMPGVVRGGSVMATSNSKNEVSGVPGKPHDNDFKKPVSWLLGPQLIASLKWVALYVGFK